MAGSTRLLFHLEEMADMLDDLEEVRCLKGLQFTSGVEHIPLEVQQHCSQPARSPLVYNADCPSMVIIATIISEREVKRMQSGVSCNF